MWRDFWFIHQLCSSCRRNEAAFGGKAVVKSDTSVHQKYFGTSEILKTQVYDDYVAERSLRPSAAATSLLDLIRLDDYPVFIRRYRQPLFGLRRRILGHHAFQLRHVFVFAVDPQVHPALGHVHAVK